MSEYCPVLSTLSEMYNFNEELKPSMELDFAPPATYKAYACGLHIIFKQQNAKLLELEKEIMLQGNK